MSSYDLGYQLGQILAPIVCCVLPTVAMIALGGLVVWQVRRGKAR